MENEDTKVLLASIDVLSQHLDDLVGACIDDDGKPRTPDRRAVIRARSMLPSRFKHSLSRRVAE
jgi:hypothetical protein